MQNNYLWLKKAQKRADDIIKLKPKMSELSDEQLKNKTAELQERYKNGASLDKLLVEAFAVVREAALRVTGMEHYPVQLVSGIALHEGKIAEQKTGEGKTLVATLPAYLNALTGKGVHIVTVNDYLANRDATLMGKIHEFLGLTVGVVISDMSADMRKKAYACDITYITNSELGFDYLRDNMALKEDMVVQRGLNYAIIDEVDSILIDEARTPLIISSNGIDLSKIYTACNAVAQKLKIGEASKEFNRMEAMLGDAPVETGDYIVHEKDKSISLTAEGIKKIETFFGLDNYSDPKNSMLCHAINQCLYANNLMKRDKDYIVKNGEVQIVDTFTGRVMDGLQFSDGLHQAIEAKEHVPIRKETRTIATITYQRFFNKYNKIAGMTGTAYSERREFKTTYGMDTVVIPTNKKVIRNDRPTVIYRTKKEKYQGVLEEVKKSYQKEQPVLIGTASIKTSEEVDYLLSMADIPHQVLNAKQDEKEAEIIAKAGIHGTVTVATNMAGRGTDIILDEESKKAGGLKVIGTELHDSVRIDNQLRGRSGRQGDPGESVFYVSTEDRLIRLFSNDRLSQVLKKCGVEEGNPLSKKIFRRYVKQAQRTVEDNHYGIRKSVLDYDMVNDEQRDLVYGERRKILSGEDIDEKFRKCLEYYADMLVQKDRGDVERIMADTAAIEELDLSALSSQTKKELSSFLGKKEKELSSFLKKELVELNKDAETGKEQRALLKGIDIAWMEQIRALECLRQCIGYQGYAQIDPKSAYALQAFDLYTKMQYRIYSIAVESYFAERSV